MNRIVLVLFLALITPLLPHTQPAPATSSDHHSRIFENHYLRIHLAPGWTGAPPGDKAQRSSGDCCIVTITHGNYVLEINPVFDHASGIIGGRVNEILNVQPSVLAVTGDDDDLLDFNCDARTQTVVTKKISLRNLYVDPAGMISNDCPQRPGLHHVWFASYASDEGPQADYFIALTYNSRDLNSLPRWNSPELHRVLRDVTGMLRTLRLNPPIVSLPKASLSHSRRRPERG